MKKISRKWRTWTVGTCAALPGVAVLGAIPSLAAAQPAETNASIIQKDVTELASAAETSFTKEELSALVIPARTAFYPGLIGLTGLALTGETDITVQKPANTTEVTYVVNKDKQGKRVRVAFRFFGMKENLDPATVLANTAKMLQEANTTNLPIQDFYAVPSAKDQTPQATAQNLGLLGFLVNDAVKISYEKQQGSADVNYTIAFRGRTQTLSVTIVSYYDQNELQGILKALDALSQSSLTAFALQYLAIAEGTPYDPETLGVLAPSFPETTVITVKKEASITGITYAVTYRGISGTVYVIMQGDRSEDTKILRRGMAAMYIANTSSTLTERQFNNQVINNLDTFDETILGMKRPPETDGFTFSITKPTFKVGFIVAREPTQFSVALTYNGVPVTFDMVPKSFRLPAWDDKLGNIKDALRRIRATTLDEATFKTTAVTSLTPIEELAQAGMELPEAAKGSGITLLKLQNAGLYFWFWGYGGLSSPGSPIDVLYVTPSVFGQPPAAQNP